MIESENMIFSKNYSGASFQNDRFRNLSSVDINEGSFFWHESNDTFVILEDAMFAQNVRTAELYVLRNVCLGRSDSGEAIFNVINQALRH